MRELGYVLVAAVLLAAGNVRAAEPDYSGFQALLQKYLHVLQVKGGPWDSRFDYEQLYVDEKIWTLHRSDLLATLHGQLLTVAPADMTPRERLSWAINAYNFLIIERLTLNLLVPRRQFTRYDSPKQVNNEEGVFFGAVVAKVGGQDYSLTGFERRFVYGDTSANPVADGTTPREMPGDPRLMCALSKGALCTGPLLPWVYRADSLEAQLDRAARLALALPAYLRPDPAGGALVASNRFFDERADFGGPQTPGLIAFLAKHGPPGARQVIREKKLTRPTMFFEPNWKLNQTEHPKQTAPGAAGADSAKVTKKS